MSRGVGSRGDAAGLRFGAGRRGLDRYARPATDGGDAIALRRRDLKPVADILGHRSLDKRSSTPKLDFDRLAQVALPWPGRKEVQ